jgi:hypothetical protein
MWTSPWAQRRPLSGIRDSRSNSSRETFIGWRLM